MKVTMIIILGLLFSAALAEDTSKVQSYWKDENNVLIRLFYFDGSLMQYQDVKIMHLKDCCPDGWRFDNQEWRKMFYFPVEPEYYNDPEYGPNGGFSIA